MVRSMLVMVDAMLMLRFLLEPVPARGRLVEAEVVGYRAAAELDHYSAQDDGHTFGGLVGDSHIIEGG
jgi:hypothetical protein